MMKKMLFLPILFFMSLVFFSSCNSSDLDEVRTQKMAKSTFVFNVVNNGNMTRSAEVGDNWPTGTKAQAESVVSKIYTTPKSAGLSFFTSNYSVKLTNDKGGSITAWNGTTAISLTEVNTIEVTLTENTVGAFPKFKTAKGTLDISKVDLDTATPSITDAVCTGDISVTGITNTDGVINVTIQVQLTYDSYLLVAPSSEWSALSTVKGFTALKWGGSNGTAFNETTSTNGNKWFYYWGNGNEYVWGKGTLISYGFNLYSDGSDDIKVVNGKWYGLFAAWSSAGEGDDDSSNTDDVTKTHTVGGTSGVTPTANDVAEGGTIR